jgi:dipeptidyl aminopeptidase/acylaminoacyl peptidase
MVWAVTAGFVLAASVSIAAPAAASAGPSSSTASSTVAPRTITHEDLWLMRRIGAPVPSPDGKWVVALITEPAYDAKAQVSDLWLIPTDRKDGRTTRRLTGTSGGEGGVTWSPDGTRLVFSARREGDEAEQLYLLDLRGGEARRLTTLTNGARGPKFSPDGRRIAFSSSDYPGALLESDNKRIAGERKARKWNARIYDGFPIRNWDRWLEDRKPRILVLDLAADGGPIAGAGGEPRNLLARSELVKAPGFAGRGGDGGDSLDAEWTPDGQGLVFVASTDRNKAAYSFTTSQLWYVGLDGAEPRRLTVDKHSWGSPTFTTDGRTLIATRERASDKVYTNTELAAFAWNGAAAGAPLGAPRLITEGWDRAVTSFAPTADSRRVYFLAEDAGHEKLYSAPLDGKGVAAGKSAVSPAFDMTRGVYTGLAIAQGTSRAGAPVIVANYESATEPPEVVRIDLAKRGHEALTAVNVERAKPLDLAPVKHFWFTSKQGRRIHNMLVLPPGFDAAKKYPLFVVIHGGPHTMFRDQWVLRWNYHLLAAPGYVVLLTNYSGSTGFGEAFAQTIQGDPLRSAGDELNEAADIALRDNAFIDASRQCAGGASYGGHLANWLQATTTRYRCLVSHAGLINLESQWGTSDTVYGREINNGGPVWEQGPVWREQNPIRYAAQFKTPTLVTIGEQDFRVPLNNSLEYWTVLQRQQIPSRLVVFPDENHWILKGENSRLFYQEIHDWLARWLGPQPAAGAPAK